MSHKALGFPVLGLTCSLLGKLGHSCLSLAIEVLWVPNSAFSRHWGTPPRISLSTWKKGSRQAGMQALGFSLSLGDSPSCNCPYYSETRSYSILTPPKDSPLVGLLKNLILKPSICETKLDSNASFSIAIKHAAI